MFVQKVELVSNFNVARMNYIGGDYEFQPYIDDIKIYYDDVMYTDIFWKSHLVSPKHDLSFILDNIELFYLGHINLDDCELQIKEIKDQELKENLISQIRKALLKETI